MARELHPLEGRVRGPAQTAADGPSWLRASSSRNVSFETFPVEVLGNIATERYSSGSHHFENSFASTVLSANG